MITGFLLLAVLVAVIATAVRLGAGWLAWRYSCRTLALAADEDCPPISILVAVKGHHEGLEANLQSFAEQDYPDYEVIFSFEDAAEPAMTAARALAAANGRVSVMAGAGDARAANPKMRNMAKAYRAARHELLMHCDANVSLEPWRLRHCAAALTGDRRLVSAVPVGCQPKGFGGWLECGFLNGYGAWFMLAGAAAGKAHAFGKLMLYRQNDLERAGGFGVLLDDPSDDTALERALCAGQGGVFLSPRPVPSPVGRVAVAAVMRRQLRWLMIRRVNRPGVFAAELATAPVTAFLAAGCAAALVEMNPATVLIPMAALWYCGEALLTRFLGWPLGPLSAPVFLVRDFLLFCLWFVALVSRRAVWRDEAVIFTRTVRAPRGSRV